MSKPKRDSQTTKRADKHRKKTVYRVDNWAEYNASLVQRGSITVWIDEKVLDRWQPMPEGRRKRGGQPKYSDRAIECQLTLKAVLHPTYRRTEGLGKSLMDPLAENVAIPDYTTLCIRSGGVESQSVAEPRAGRATHRGGQRRVEGLWGGRMEGAEHGVSERRTWRKLPLSVNEATQWIEAVVLTEAGVDDAEAGGDLLEETSGSIQQVRILPVGLFLCSYGIAIHP